MHFPKVFYFLQCDQLTTLHRCFRARKETGVKSTLNQFG